MARERSGERDPLPLAAGELSRLRLGQRGDPEPLEEPVAVARERDVALDGHVREQRVLLEHVADRSFLGAAIDAVPNQARRCTAIDPRLGRLSPAIASRTVVLPAPDGPTSPTVSGPTSSATSTSKERVGTVRSSRSVPMSKSLEPDEDRCADDDEERADCQCDVEVRVELGIDRERQRLGHPLEAAGEDDRRAELSEPARQRQRRGRAEPARRRAGPRRDERRATVPRRGSGLRKSGCRRRLRTRRSRHGGRRGSRRSDRQDDRELGEADLDPERVNSSPSSPKRPNAAKSAMPATAGGRTSGISVRVTTIDLPKPAASEQVAVGVPKAGLRRGRSRSS